MCRINTYFLSCFLLEKDNGTNYLSNPGLTDWSTILSCTKLGFTQAQIR